MIIVRTSPSSRHWHLQEVMPQLLVGLWFDSAHHETIELHNNKKIFHTERSRSVKYL